MGDYFPGRERGRVYGCVLAGELAGAGFGYAVSGDLAALSWRAAFVILAVPAFALAWAVFRMPEPARGGQGALPPETDARPGAPAGARGGAAPRPQAEAAAGDAAARPDGAEAQTDAQRLARGAGVEAGPVRPPPRDLRRINLLRASRYVLRAPTNVLLIVASACGYYFLAGVETFGPEFARCCGASAFPDGSSSARSPLPRPPWRSCPRCSSPAWQPCPS